MQTVRNGLSDPSLHMLAIALVVAYLAFGRGPRPEDSWAESPLPTCKTCHGHYLPGKTCECQFPGRIAHAMP